MPLPTDVLSASKRAVRWGAVSLMLFLIAACATTETPRYQAPSDPATAATVLGSRVPGPGSLTNDVLAVVTHIDGLSTGAKWDTPVRVSPGQHDLRVNVSGGEKILATGYTRHGATSFQVTLDAGMTYTIRTILEQGFKVTVWLEDRTGSLVGERMVYQLDATQRTPMIIYY